MPSSSETRATISFYMTIFRIEQRLMIRHPFIRDWVSPKMIVLNCIVPSASRQYRHYDGNSYRGPVGGVSTNKGRRRRGKASPDEAGGGELWASVRPIRTPGNACTA